MFPFTLLYHTCRWWFLFQKLFSYPVAVLFSELFLTEEEHAHLPEGTGKPFASVPSDPAPWAPRSRRFRPPVPSPAPPCPPRHVHQAGGRPLVLALSQESQTTFFFSIKEKKHSSTFVSARSVCIAVPVFSFAAANDNMMTYSTIRKLFLCN